MHLPNPWQGDDAILRLLVEGMRKAGGEPIVFHYLVHGRASYDDRPDDRLTELSPECVRYDRPLELASKVWVTALGLERVDPGSPEIHRGFVPALRELVDVFVRHEPGSPTQAERVMVRADDLGFSAPLSVSQLRMVGHLLEGEGIGPVEWADDQTESWTIELGLQILQYRRVATFDDFLRVKFTS